MAKAKTVLAMALVAFGVGGGSAWACPEGQYEQNVLFGTICVVKIGGAVVRRVVFKAEPLDRDQAESEAHAEAAPTGALARGYASNEARHVKERRKPDARRLSWA